MQLSPALLLVAGWSSGTAPRRWALLLGGAVIPIAALGLTDWIAWGSPFQSVWKYVLVNGVEGRAESFGTQPAGWYFATLTGLWGGAILPFALVFAIGARRAVVPALTAGAVVLTHSIVAHKEFGFIFAALPLAIIVAGIGTAEIVRMATKRLRLRPALLSALALIAVLWLGATVTVHGRYREAFTNASDYLRAMQTVHALPDLCGLGLWYPGWASYAFIDRPVPMYLMTTPAQFTDAAPQFNYLLVAQGSPPGAAEFSVDRCWNAVCLLKAQRSCRPSGNDEINAALRERGL